MNLILLLTVLLVSASSGNTSEIAQEVFQRVTPNVVMIESRHGTGTGFFINPQTILTNRHVVFGYSKEFNGWNAPRSIRLKNGYRISSYQLMICSREIDLCLICLKNKYDVNPVELSSSGILPGNDLFIVGHPRGIRQQILSTGIVSSRSVLIPGSDVRGNYAHYNGFSTNAAISPGSSGSPVIAANGSVLGIVVSSMRDSQNLNFVISSSEILKLYRSSLNSETGNLILPFGFEKNMSFNTAEARGRKAGQGDSGNLTIRLDGLESKASRASDYRVRLGGFWLN